MDTLNSDPMSPDIIVSKTLDDSMSYSLQNVIIRQPIYTHKNTYLFSDLNIQ